jgi:hypothetical protein
MLKQVSYMGGPKDRNLPYDERNRLLPYGTLREWTGHLKGVPEAQKKKTKK